jgi:hypothetical protein
MEAIVEFSNKIQVTYDRFGTILSAYRVPSARQDANLRTGVVPDASNGIGAAEIELPGQFAELDLPRFAQEFRVDVREQPPRLIACGHDNRSD